MTSPARTPTPPPLPTLKHREPLVRVAVCRPTQAVEPPATRWIFPSTPPDEPPSLATGSDGGPDGPDEEPVQGRPAEVVGIGADLEPGTLLRAYRSGVFPMPVRRGLMAWWSPEPRGVIPLSGLLVTRSLRRSCAKFTVRIDTAFEEVISACGDRSRKGAWIDSDIRAAYLRLHRWGWAHSVEAWDDYGRLAGGLYGVAIGGFFAGESMFHRQNDASKVALVGLVEQLQAAEAKLLDVQWATPHLKSLGAVEVGRAQYLERLSEAILEPQPAAFGGSPHLPPPSPLPAGGYGAERGLPSH